jgi:hypothetical protein
MPRPANHLNLQDQQFGLLLVMEPATSRTWHCVCACGNHVEVLTANLRQNRRVCSRSCPDRASRKAEYLAQMEADTTPVKDIAVAVRATVIDNHGADIGKLSSKQRAEFHALMKYYINLALGEPK